jgi:competence ComEA-like helix-hairpin-helix protein
MSTFSTTPLDPAVLDPRKRVRYATGLVLGVDEFQQEQSYLMERDRRHQRTLHGYGTVHGLDVRVRLRDGEPEVLVMPGLAVDPAGRDICVLEPQCARLNAWLADHADEVREAAGSFPDGAALHVVLCYRECETDTVPIPGSPCRSEDATQVASRIADHFELALTTEPPDHAEEDAVRRFGALLRRFRVSDEAPVLTADAVATLVRALPEAPAPGGGDGSTALHLHPDDAAELLRLAFRVWTVEVRPHLAGEGGCTPPPRDACVALGRVDVALAEADGTLSVDAEAPAGPGGVAGVRVRQRGRPYLLSTRVLQEWLALCTRVAAEEPGSFPEDEILLALNDLIDVEASPGEGDVLTWDGVSGSWTARPPEAGTVDHGALSGLEDDDHPRYLPVDGSRPMAADLELGGNRVVGLSSGSAPGHAVPFQQAVKQGDGAGGDLAGSYPAPTVAGLRGRPVAGTAPSANQVLTWSGSAWTPRAVSPTGNFERRLVRITGASWYHRGTSALRVVVDGEPTSGLVVAFGFRQMRDGGTVLVRAGSLDAQSFELFAEVDDGTGFYRYRGIRPDPAFQDLAPSGIVPVELDDVRSRPWQVSTTSPKDPAHAAFFPVPAGVQDGLFGVRLRVVIHGDFVRDPDGRAIDAEHLRGTLEPDGSGDRPAGAEVGLQGGRFESWFTLDEEDAPPDEGREDRLRVDLGRASREELIALPGIGETLADRILDARERGESFTTAEDLLRVSGISERVVEGLRDRIRFP